MKYKEICIGIDQSYQNTGISVSADSKLVRVSSFPMSHLDNNSEKRFELRNTLVPLIKVAKSFEPEKLVCIIERIRLRSKGYINMNYIEGMGALNSIIIDTMKWYDIDTYSVDTRAWKSQVIGSIKKESNKYGVPEEKWLTVKWCIDQGFRKSITECVDNTRKKKGTFIKNGKKYMFNHDAADSAGISMYWFVGNRDLLKLEN